MKKSNKIAIIGGTGMVGRHIAAHATEQGYSTRMLVRNVERLTYRNEWMDIVEGQVQNIDNLRDVLDGCSVVINTFGQPVKESPIYSKVTKNIFDLLSEFNIKRYIGVTGGSLTILQDQKRLINRIGARLFSISFPDLLMDRQVEWEYLLRNSQIDWTMIRLPFVKDSLESKELKVNLVDMPGTKITNRDIAAFIINQINEQQYVHKAPFISH